MEEIRIMQKPDSVSYDDIHDLLLAAHKKNIEKGIVLQYAQMSGDEIKEKLGEEGRCWVAFCGDQLVGTTSVTFFQGNGWWDRGKKVAHGCFTGILGKYQGIGILEDLNALKYEYIKERGADMNQGDTAEDNYTMLKVLHKQGYKTVSYFAPENTDHYSVRVVKWLNECPYSDNYINKRCKWSERLTKMRYKPGKIERSRFTTFLSKKLKKWLKLG